MLDCNYKKKQSHDEILNLMMNCERHQPPIFRGRFMIETNPAPGVGPKDLELVDRFAKLRGCPVGHFVLSGNFVV